MGVGGGGWGEKNRVSFQGLGQFFQFFAPKRLNPRFCISLVLMIHAI